MRNLSKLIGKDWQKYRLRETEEGSPEGFMSGQISLFVGKFKVSF